MATDLKIQKAFLDGISLIWNTMFTQFGYISLLDEENTSTNVYGETTEKSYFEPIKLAILVRTDFEQGSDPVEDVKVDAVIKIPAKELIEAGLVTKEYVKDSEIEKLRKAKITYGGVVYLVSKVHPRVLIADTWHIYDFYCYRDKVRVC